MGQTNDQANAIEHRFFAALHSFNAAAKTATFYLMNTTRNRNKWGVTEKALTEALPSLIKKPIGMGAGYKVDRHYPKGQTMDSGSFVSFDNKGSYALATAKIDDAETLRMLQAGEIGAISVVIYGYHAICSSCNVNLTAEEDYLKHDCIGKKDAYLKIESFAYVRVDFVAVPAYPQAGLLDLAAKSEQTPVPLTLLAAFYESQAQPPTQTQTKGREPNQTQTTPKNGGLKMSENEHETLASLEQANKELVAANAQITKDLAAAVDKATKSEAEQTTMKAQLGAITKERHDNLVAETLEVRTKAGLSGKPEDEKAFLAKLPDETLALLKGDALKVAQVTKTEESPAPKTRYGKSAEEPLLAAVNEQRAKIGLTALKELN